MFLDSPAINHKCKICAFFEKVSLLTICLDSAEIFFVENVLVKPVNWIPDGMKGV